DTSCETRPILFLWVFPIPSSHTRSHTHTVFLRSTVSSLRANVKCTSKKDSLWRATKPTRRNPGTSTFGLVPGYKHSAPLGLVILHSHTHTHTDRRAPIHHFRIARQYEVYLD